MTVGELIKAALKKRGINQSQLAELSNITPAQISRIISGERGASIDTLILIADILGIRREDMLRAAAGLTNLESANEWAKRMGHVLEMLGPENRKLAEKLAEQIIETFVEKEMTPQKTKKNTTNI